MTVRACFTAMLLLALLAGTGGCGVNDPTAVIAETEEPLYREGQELKRKGRPTEALVSFLKLIERRGEQPSPESHLEAGTVCLEHTKNYNQAIYHFEKYIALRGPHASNALGLVRTAKREFARTLPAIPDEVISGKLSNAAELEQLRRENAELRRENTEMRAALAASRGALPSLPSRNRTNTIMIPEPAGLSAVAPPPVLAVPVRTPDRAIAPVVPAAEASASSRVAPAPRGRTFTVPAGGVGLWAIARQFDPVQTGRMVRAIVAANPDVLPQGESTTLKPGMVLRIP